MRKYKAVVFDTFSINCYPYFNGKTDCNNGYGCDHVEQELSDVDESGSRQGLCFCHSCPLGIEAETCELDKSDPDAIQGDIDWDGNINPETDTEISEGEYLLLESDEFATDEEKEALAIYDRYTHRYDKEWLANHPG